MYKAYVGSTNAVKVAAVREVLPGYEVHGINVDSKVSKQPFSDVETLTGATNRAQALPADGLRFGLEAGVEVTCGKMFLVNFGVLIDEENRVYYAGGTRIPLPEAVRKILETGKYELAEVMDTLYHTEDIKHKEGAIGLLTNQMVRRVDIFTHIVKLLYGQYLYQKEGGK